MVRPGVTAAPQPLELWSTGSNPVGGTTFQRPGLSAEQVPQAGTMELFPIAYV